MSSSAQAAGPAHLAENVMHFARVLRSAGVPVGSDRILLSLQALSLGGLERREDFKATLAACLIGRTEHLALFDQAFHVFWRDPELLGRIMAMLLPRADAAAQAAPPPENRRLAAALFGEPDLSQKPSGEDQFEIDASLTFSAAEVLRKADFETMSVAEWISAKRLLQHLVPQMKPRPTRRIRAARRGRSIDWPASLAATARHGDLAALRYLERRRRIPPLVVLADISGSMSKYSRMLLHFAHALSNAGVRVETFVFGTRLTSVSRQLRQRDADIAVAAVVREVEDWSGGTRISACVRAFNRDWSRRVLGQQAEVLLISDGLEHGDVQALSDEMDRLAKSCSRLIWLNPLLRYQAFEARAAGIRAILPHVDAFLPAHNLESLEALGVVLSQAYRRR